MIQILIVEDDWNAREGLKERFPEEPDFEVIGSAQTEEEALELLETSQPDVVVLDVRLHGKDSGLKIADEIRMHHWPTQILVYSAHDAPEMVDTMLNKGAMGYYVKDGRNTVKDMLTAVRTVARGERWFGNGLEAWMASKLRVKEEEEVTPYQMDILQMVAEGKTNKEIAQVFDVDPRTVESHIYRICKKIGANNRTHDIELMTIGVDESIKDGVEIVFGIEHTIEIIEEKGQFRIVKDDFTDRAMDNPEGFDNVNWSNNKFVREKPTWDSMIDYVIYHTPIEVLGQRLLEDVYPIVTPQSGLSPGKSQRAIVFINNSVRCLFFLEIFIKGTVSIL